MREFLLYFCAGVGAVTLGWLFLVLLIGLVSGLYDIVERWVSL